MAAISIALNNGLDGFQIVQFTVGTAAPTALTDMEFRFNTTDQNSNTITKKTLVNTLDAFKRAIESDSFFITMGL
jgi:hypothetical protein